MFCGCDRLESHTMLPPFARSIRITILPFVSVTTLPLCVRTAVFASQLLAGTLPQQARKSSSHSGNMRVIMVHARRHRAFAEPSCCSGGSKRYVRSRGRAMLQREVRTTLLDEMPVVELYRSANLLVRCSPCENTLRWVVTFDNYGSPPGFDRPCFGEAFLAARGVSVISVLGKGNDWYQYPDTPLALDAVRRAVAGAERVVTYGSSMGGYAAIRFADAVGAHACLALSPQYSNDPAKVPFEWRWGQEARSLSWRPELDGVISCSIRPILVFDSANEDSRHAAMIARDVAVELVAIPYAAHPATTYLHAVGMLERIVFEVIDDRFDRAMFSREANAARRNSAIYISELARRQPSWRPRLGVALARMAVEKMPDSDLLLHVLAKRLTDAGEHDEALPLHARAVELSNGHIGYVLPYSMALAAAGQDEAALRLASGLAEENPDYAQFHGWLAHLYWKAGLAREAIRAITRARSLAPANGHYLKAQLHYRSARLVRLPAATREITRCYRSLLGWASGFFA
jgi:tetratricopeptide (TPR) repeat protein